MIASEGGQLSAAPARVALYGAFVMVPLAMCAPCANGQEGTSTAVNLFGTHRFEEDFSFLRDSTKREDFWDPLKFIPATGDHDLYLALGGELRERYTYVRNPGFGRQGLDSDDFLLHRLQLHADFHVDKHLRAFAQVSSHLEKGKNGAVTTTEEDRLDLQQGFLDAAFDLVPSVRATLRAGRQELAYGSQRLVSVRDSPNVRRSFDGLRGVIRVGNARFDAFVTRPVVLDRGVFDDEGDDTQAFWGVYAVAPIALVQSLNADLYYLGLQRDIAPFTPGTAEERRHSIGTRLWGAQRNWDYNLELVGQFGEFGRADIWAWTVSSDTGYTLVDLPLQPRVGLRADLASGDDDPNDGTLGTFNALFPKLNYLTEAALVAPANIIEFFPSVGLQPVEGLSVTIGWDFLWRHSKDDAFYMTPLTPVLDTAASTGRPIGNQIDIEAIWKLTRHVVLNAAYVHFNAGKTLRDAGGQDVDFVALWATYRF